MKQRSTLFFLVGLLCIVFAANAATRTASVSGQWNSSATWVGGIIPGSSDDVIIPSGKLVTLTGTGSCQSLTINIGGTFKFAPNAHLNYTGSASPVIAGTVDFTALGSTFEYSNTGSVDIQDISYFNLLISSGSKRVVNNNNPSVVLVKGNLSVLGSGAMNTNDGNDHLISVVGSVIGDGSITINNDAGSGGSNLVVNGSFLFTGTFDLQDASTFLLSSASSQTITAQNFTGMVTFSGGSKFLIDPNLVDFYFNNDFINNSSLIYDQNSDLSLHIIGNYYGGGNTIDMSGGGAYYHLLEITGNVISCFNLIPGTGDVQYDGGIQTVCGGNYNNLSISNAGILKILQGNTTVSGTLGINAILSVGGFDIWSGANGSIISAGFGGGNKIAFSNTGNNKLYIQGNNAAKFSNLNYPIGFGGTDYQPVIINNITGTVGTGSYIGIRPLISALGTNSVSRMYSVTSSGFSGLSLFDALFTFAYPSNVNGLPNHLNRSLSGVVSSVAGSNVILTGFAGQPSIGGFTLKAPNAQIDGLYFVQGIVAPISITAFNPQKAFPGQSIVINGFGFDPIPGNNIVWIGNVACPVMAASANQLTITVPKGIVYDNLNVFNKTNGASAKSAAFFTPVFIGSNTFSSNSFSTSPNIGGPSNNGVAIGDLNGDGKPDIATVSVATSKLDIYLNAGGGVFSTTPGLLISGNPNAVAMADLNGDGSIDLVVANYSSSVVSVFTNTGTGSFGSNLDYNTGLGPNSVAIGDLNGDGKLDLVTANSYTGANSVSVLLNLGNASFIPKTDYPTVVSPYTAIIGDVDADGKPDILVSNNGVSGWGILLNTGAGAFGTKTNYATTGLVYGLALGDLDGDGKVDVATANYTAGTVSVWPNSGFGTFPIKTDYPASPSPSIVAISDFNGDDKLDVAVNHFFSSTVSVLQNLGAGTLGVSADYPTGYSNAAFALGDLNGDGRADFPLAFNGTIATLQNLNTISFTPTIGGIGSLVTVNGSNLDSVTGVAFNGTNAPFTLINPTLLVITVPSGATTGPLTAYNNYYTATGANFQVAVPGFYRSIVTTGIWSTPSTWEVSTNGGVSFAPTVGYPGQFFAGDVVSISGTNAVTISNTLPQILGSVTINGGASITSNPGMVVTFGGTLVNNGGMAMSGNVYFQNGIIYNTTSSQSISFNQNTYFVANDQSFSGLSSKALTTNFVSIVGITFTNQVPTFWQIGGGLNGTDANSIFINNAYTYADFGGMPMATGKLVSSLTGSIFTYNSNLPQQIQPIQYGGLQFLGSGLKTLIGDVSVGGTLTLDGPLDFGVGTARTLSVAGLLNPTSTIDMNANLAHSLILAGMVFSNAGATITSGGGLSSVSYISTLFQQILRGTYNNLVVSGGVKNVTTCNIAVSNNLALNGAVIDLDAGSSLTLQPNASITGLSFSGSNMIQMDGSTSTNSYIDKQVTVPADFIGLYPIGILGAYSPLSITGYSGYVTSSSGMHIKPIIVTLTGSNYVNKQLATFGQGLTTTSFNFKFYYPATDLIGTPNTLVAQTIPGFVNLPISGGYLNLGVPDYSYGIATPGNALLDALWTVQYIAPGLYRSVSSGNWSTPSNWQLSTDNGATWSVAIAYPGQFSFLDAVSISGSNAINNDVSLNYPISSLTISGNLFVTNSLSISGASLINANGTLAGINNPAKMIFGGLLTNDGIIDNYLGGQVEFKNGFVNNSICLLNSVAFTTSNQTISGVGTMRVAGVTTLFGIDLAQQTYFELSGNIDGTNASSRLISQSYLFFGDPNLPMSTGQLIATHPLSYVSYSYYGNQPIRTNDYYHLHVNSPGNKFVTGTITANQITGNVPAGTYSFSNAVPSRLIALDQVDFGSSFDMSGGALPHTLEIQGIVNNFISNPIIPGLGKVIYNGTSNQDIINTNYYDLEVGGGSIKTPITTSGFAVLNTLNLNGGVIDLTLDILDMRPGSTIIAGTTLGVNNMIRCQNTSVLGTCLVRSGSSLSDFTGFVYPIGNNLGYTPVAISGLSGIVSPGAFIFAKPFTTSITAPNNYVNRAFLMFSSSITGVYDFRPTFGYLEPSERIGLPVEVRFKQGTTTPVLINGGFVDQASGTFGVNAAGNTSIDGIWMASSLDGQTIVGFNAIPAQPITNPTYLITNVTATSGLTVGFTSSNPAIASISGNTINILGAGIVTITATQVGNGIYAASTPVSQVLLIVPDKPLGNRGMYFDGVQNFAQTSTINLNDFTFEFWIKTKQTGGLTDYWFDGHALLDADGGSTSDDYGISLGNGSIVAGTGKVGEDFSIASTKTVNDGAWHHVAYTRQGLYLEIYIDGLLDKSGSSIAINGPVGGIALTFGRGASAGNFFNGQLDEIRIFNTVRTPTEIVNDMSSQAPNGALAYWNFDDDVAAGVQTVAVNSGTGGTSLNGNLAISPANPLWSLRVTNNTDNAGVGLGSLRQALNEANTDTDQDYIDFSMPSGIQTIQPLNGNGSYNLSQPVFIDGFTQYNATAGENSTPNTNPFGQPINAKLNVVINGASAGANSGFLITSNNNYLKGLVVNSFSVYAIEWQTPVSYTTISGCFLGTTRDGNAAVSNGYSLKSGTGGGSSFNLIGGYSDADRNLLGSGQFDLNSFQSSTITGNYVGTDATSSSYLGNTYLTLIYSSNNVLDKNLFSSGLVALSANNTIIRNNLFGTKADGTGFVSNSDIGVNIGSSDGSQSSINCIIANNIIANKSIGVNINMVSTNNTISGNNIYFNTTSGIYLAPGSPAGNNNKAAPTITSAQGNIIQGICATCGASDVIEVFNDSPQSGATNQGRTYLGQATRSGTNWYFYATVNTGDRITTTATDNTNGTSAFSSALTVTSPVIATTPSGNRGLYFDGIDDKVVTNTFSLTDFTIEFWIKTKQIGGVIGNWYGGIPVLDADIAGPSNDYGISLANGQIQLGVAGGAVYAEQSIASNAVINDGAWHHVAAFRNTISSVLGIYIDGILDVSVPGTVLNAVSGYPLNLGASTGGNGLFFNGQLDEIRISNSARYNTPSFVPLGSFPGIDANTLALYHLDEATGQTANDAVGANNGILGNSTAIESADPFWSFRVKNTNDAGIESLRQNIIDANTDTDTDYIDFSIQQSNTTIVSTINIATSLPISTNPIFLDGYSAFGSLPNTSPLSGGNNAALRVELDCSVLSGNLIQFNQTGTVKGLSAYGNNVGFLAYSSNFLFDGNFIGVKADGSTVTGSGNGLFSGGGQNNVTFSGNVIGNVAYGIQMNSNNSICIGNLVGVTPDGLNRIPLPSAGVLNAGTNNTLVGNVFVGNGYSIFLSGSSATVKGNYIGTDVSGTLNFGTSGGAGILMTGNNNTIGGINPGDANVIAYNSFYAVWMQTGINNKVSGNSIYSNTSSNAIKLDPGANNNKAAPIIYNAKVNLISGGCALGDVVEVFNDSPPTGSTNQGRTFLGVATTTGTSWTFSGAFSLGDRITATATDNINGTSPFSNADIVIVPPLITSFTPTSGVIGTPIVISGSGFNPSAPNDVYFGAIKAIGFGDPTGTSITVNVPTGATSIAPIVVRNNANGRQASSLETILSAGTRQFTVTNSPVITPFYSRTDIGSGLQVYDIQTGDFNNDGKTDMAIARGALSLVGAYLGNGDGTFAIPTNYNVPSTTRSLAVEDFNGDGNQDLAIAVETPCNCISIRLGDGSGGFAASTTYPVLSVLPRCVKTGDFNGDGKLDLVTANQTGNNVSVLLGDGSGGFGIATNFTLGGGANAPIYIEVTDFNGDGKADIVTANYVSSNASILLGDGIGGFGTPLVRSLSGATIPYTVVVGDFDGDNNQDFATGNNGSGDMSFFIGDGSGGFTGPTTKPINATPYPSGVTVADFNGDGLADIGAASYSTGKANILVGNGSLNFATPSSFNVIASPTAMAIGDFNNDGKTDFVTGNASISVMLYTPALTGLFRSKTNGNWSNSAIWEVSTDAGLNFQNTAQYPGQFSTTDLVSVTGGNNLSLDVSPLPIDGLTVSGVLSVTSNNFTISGQTFVTDNGILLNGANQYIQFQGLVTQDFSAMYSTLSSSTTEFQNGYIQNTTSAGFNTFFNGNIIYSTNNQTFTGVGNFPDFKGNITVLGAISVTDAHSGSFSNISYEGWINGTSSLSGFIFASNKYVNYSNPNMPMQIGEMDVSSNFAFNYTANVDQFVKPTYYNSIQSFASNEIPKRIIDANLSANAMSGSGGQFYIVGPLDVTVSITGILQFYNNGASIISLNGNQNHQLILSGSTSNVNPTLTISSGINSSVIYNAPFTQEIFMGQYSNLIVDNIGYKFIDKGVISVNNLSITGGATLDTKQYQITGNATGTMLMDAGTTLLLGDLTNLTSPGIGFPSLFSASNISLDPSSTVVYQSGNTGSPVSVAPIKYANLQIDGSGTLKQLQSNTTVSGDLFIKSGYLEMGNYISKFDVIGNSTINGVFQYNNSYVNATANFYGNVECNNQLNLTNYYCSTLPVTNIFGNLTGNGNLTVGNATGCVNTLNLFGQINTLSGILTYINSIINYKGIGDQEVLSGTYEKLGIYGGGIKTLNGDISINNNLTLGGAYLEAGNSKITLNNDISNIVSIPGIPFDQTNMINCSVNGVTKYISSANSFVLPIGIGSSYTPFSFTNALTSFVNATPVMLPSSISGTDYVQIGISVSGVNCATCSFTMGFPEIDQIGNPRTLYRNAILYNTLSGASLDNVNNIIGYTTTNNDLNGLWFALSNLPSIYLPKNNFCAGEIAVLTLGGVGTFAGGNVFSITLEGISASSGGQISYPIASFPATNVQPPIVFNVTIPSNFDVSGNSLYFTASSTNPADAFSTNPIVTITNLQFNSFINNGLVCEGNTIVLSAVSVTGANYTWSGPNLFSANTQNVTFTGATTALSGVYSVGLESNGCVSPLQNTTVYVATIPAVNVNPQNQGVCSPSTPIYFTATGANTYTWSTSAATLNTITGSQVNTTYQPNSNSFVSVTGTSIYGCVATTFTGINYQAPLTNSAVSLGSFSTCAPYVFSNYTVSGASGYIMEVATSSSFSGGFVSGFPQTITSATLTISGFPTEAAYYFRSTPFNSCNQGGVTTFLGKVSLVAPSVSSFNPSLGFWPNGISIAGSDLSFITNLSVGGNNIPSTYSSASSSSVIANVISASGIYTGGIQLSNSCGTSSATAQNYTILGADIQTLLLTGGTSINTPQGILPIGSTITNIKGSVIQTPLVWAISNPALANYTVSSNLQSINLQAVDNGVVTITAYSLYDPSQPSGTLVVTISNQAVIRVSISPTNNLCSGQFYTASTTISGSGPTNMNIELSDAVGSFVSPTVVGTAAFSTGITSNIPFSIPGSAMGLGYRIRVTAGSFLSFNNGADITIYQSPSYSLPISAGVPDICLGGSGIILIANSQPTSDYRLYNNQGSFLTGLIPGNGSNLSISVAGTNLALGNNTFTIKTRSNVGCGNILQPMDNTASFNVVQNPTSTNAITASKPAICQGDTVSITVGNAESGVIYSIFNNAIDLNQKLTGTGSNLVFPISTGNLNAGTNNFTLSGITPACSVTSPLVNSVVVTSVLLPTVTGIADQNVCSGNSLNISFTGIPQNANFDWQVANAVGNVFGQVNGSGSTINQSLNGIGNFDYIVTPSLGNCSGIPVTFNVKLTTPPRTDLSVESVTVCGGPSATIRVFNAEQGVTYFPRLNAITFLGSNVIINNDVALNIPQSSLTGSNNQVQIFASTQVCTPRQLDSLSTIVVVSPVNIPSITGINTGTANCDKLNLKLEVTTFAGYIGYQWRWNGREIVDSTATTPVYTPVIDGTYTVDVFSTNNCKQTTDPLDITLKYNSPKPTITNIGSGTNIILQASVAASYQWYYGKKAIIGEVNQEFIPFYNALYNVKINAGDLCSLRSDDFAVTGFADDLSRQAFEQTDTTILIRRLKMIGKSNLKLYPNPARQNVNLSFDSGNENTMTTIAIRFVNSLGIETYKTNYITQNGKMELDIDISTLPSGIYKVIVTESGHQFIGSLAIE